MLKVVCISGSGTIKHNAKKKSAIIAAEKSLKGTEVVMEIPQHFCERSVCERQPWPQITEALEITGMWLCDRLLRKRYSIPKSRMMMKA